MTTSYAILYATVSAIEITSLRFHVATNDASFECLRFENQQPRCSAKRFFEFFFFGFFPRGNGFRDAFVSSESGWPTLIHPLRRERSHQA